MKSKQGGAMKFQKVLTILCLSFVGTGALLNSSKSDAAVVQMVVATESVLDPETGQSGYRVMNPKGEVDMTYTSSGALIQFVGTDGKPDAFKITTSYPNRSPRETKNPAQNIYNKILAQTLARNGNQLPATFLRNVSQEMAQGGQTLGIYFDRTGRIGFHIREFDLAEVKIISGASTVSLAEAIFNMVSSNAKAQVEQMMAEQRRIHLEKLAATVSCDALFVSVP